MGSSSPVTYIHRIWITEDVAKHIQNILCSVSRGVLSNERTNERNWLTQGGRETSPCPVYRRRQRVIRWRTNTALCIIPHSLSLGINEVSSSAGHIRCSRLRLSTAAKQSIRQNLEEDEASSAVCPSGRSSCSGAVTKPSLVHRSESEGWIGDRPGIYLFKCQKTNDSNEWPSVIFKCPT